MRDTRKAERHGSGNALLNRLTGGACLVFALFVVVRAIRVPLTYDEAATYERYIAADLLSIFNFELATNHFLNTVLTKVCYIAGGDSEVVLRTANLLGYAMYVCSSILLLNAVTRPTIAFCGFMLLNLNAYLLDFFSLSRGYGLSLGLLMTALFFLYRFVDASTAGAFISRHLRLALFFAGAAVLANLTLLNVYAGIFLIVLAALIHVNRVTSARTQAGMPADSVTPRNTGSFAWLPVVAAVFFAAVFSQDIRLSTNLYEPVAVRLVGLQNRDLDTVTVSRIDVHGRVTPIRSGETADVWRQNARENVTALRIEMPCAAAGHLASIEVTVGSERFGHNRDDGAWTAGDAGATCVLESGPSISLPKPSVPAFRRIINWAGDRRYLAYVGAYTAIAMSLLGLVAIGLHLVGWVALRARLLTSDQWRPLRSGVLWLAALMGAPLYLLTRNSALYFGGPDTVLADTLFSIVEGSFYGRTYHPAQARVVLVGLVASVAAFGGVLYVSYRRGQLRLAVPALTVFALILTATTAAFAQRFVFDSPYPFRRTGLFYIPLCVLFVTFVCEALAALGRTAAAFAISALIAAVCASAYHFVNTANVKSAWEWQKDAATRMMIEDVAHTVSVERPPGSKTVVGVDWMFSTVAVFYAKKQSAHVIDVIVVPSAQPVDFVYVDERNRTHDMIVIRRYPVAGSLLARGDAAH